MRLPLWLPVRYLTLTATFFDRAYTKHKQLQLPFYRVTH
jgi:hypothetical protein